jgi:hypothetical protein
MHDRLQNTRQLGSFTGFPRVTKDPLSPVLSESFGGSCFPKGVLPYPYFLVLSAYGGASQNRLCGGRSFVYWGASSEAR